MASSSKTINMPLVFAISIGATVALLATTMFGLAWYQYEARVVLREQVLEGPTHNRAYDNQLDQQLANLGDIDAAITSIAAEHVKDTPQGSDAHGTHEGHRE